MREESTPLFPEGGLPSREKKGQALPDARESAGSDLRAVVGHGHPFAAAGSRADVLTHQSQAIGYPEQIGRKISAGIPPDISTIFSMLRKTGCS
jgi:hypothetical protein